MKTSNQHGTLIRFPQKSGDVWKLRYRLNGVHRFEILGTVKDIPTEDKARRIADRRLKELFDVPEKAHTISDLIDRFQKECQPRNASTAHSYASFCGRIRTAWGHVTVESIPGNLPQLGKWVNNLKLIDRKTQRPTKTDASPTYKQQMRGMLSLLLDKAMLWQMLPITRNPIELIRLEESASRQKEIVTLDPEQYRQLLEDPELPLLVKTMIQVTAGLGLRISEVLGLRWEDVDLVERCITIRRSMVKGVADKTKTSSSKAQLPLHEHLCKVLREWRMAEPIVEGWVFGSARTGLPFDRDHLRGKYLIPAGERLGLKIGFHTLRHSYRAWLRSIGASLEDQKEAMRHARIATTIDVYGGREKAEALRPVNAAVMNLLEGKVA